MIDPRERIHVSRNRLEGSLGDTPLERILDACHRHLVTGTVRVRAFGGEGCVELRAGAVDEAAFGRLVGRDAVARMSELRDGLYVLTQQLPDLSGALGGAAQFEGDIDDMPLIALMRHCEDNALSCTIALTNGEDDGELVYRAGEITKVALNGEVDEDRIVDLVQFSDARFTVSALPLDLDIEGWPCVGRAPTVPFTLERGDEPRALPLAPVDDIVFGDADRPDDTDDIVGPEYDALVITTEAAPESGAPQRSLRVEPTDRVFAPHQVSAGEAVLWFGVGALGALAVLGVAFVLAALLA